MKLYRHINPKAPRIIDYQKYYPYLSSLYEGHDKLIPTLFPNWDHSPRSKSAATVLINTTPDNFEKHAALVNNVLTNNGEEEQICFLKSWNEWGEGNYVEPDLKYGDGVLKVIKKYFGTK